jgi:transcription elongation factor GreA
VKKTFYLTKAGAQKLKNQLAALLTEREHTLEDLKTARGFGDVNENSEYLSASLQLERIQSQIEQIENIMENAAVIQKSAKRSTASVGSIIELRTTNGNLKQFQLVSTIEADPLHDKISDESPLGRALLGKTHGDEVTIQTPAAAMVYTIVNIA